MSLKEDFKNSVWWFSGGGMKIYWHAGVVEALFELGLNPTIIGGTSSGSIVAAAIPRIGINKFNEILFSLKKQSDVFNCSLWNKIQILLGKRNGQYDLNALDKLMEKHIKPYPPKYNSIAVYVNWNSTKVEYAYSTDPDYFTYVKASSSIPVVMTMVPNPKKKGEWLCDGGARNQLDVYYARKTFPGKKIIAVGTNPFRVDGPYENNKDPGLIDALEQAVDILSHETYYRDIDDYINRDDIVFILPDQYLDIKTTEVDPVKGLQIKQKGYEKTLRLFKD